METCTSSPDEEVVFEACSICGRTFNPSSLERHEKICEKTKTKQRKVFDSFQQRAKDIAAVPIKSKQEENKKPAGKWKAQHEELIKTVRNEKNTSSTPPKSGESRPQQKVIPLGYTQCPVCRRCFNHKAADRHISWCQEQLSRLPKSPPSSEAMMRLRARVQYRAPLPGKKRFFSVDGQRLVKSAESCKSASAHRVYSSPCSSKSIPNIKQVAFQPQPILRRRSCERSTFNETSTELYRNCNTLPSKSTFRTQPSHNASVKFKEKFPNYQGSRASCNYYSIEEDSNMFLCEDSTPTIRRNENMDLLRALRLQLAELQATDRCNKNSRMGSDFNLPSVARHGSSTSRGSDGECRASSDASLPSVGQQPVLPRMPRFCYQCGTKYPLASAKYCCECGAKRLVLGPGENASPVL